jgi:hypothetical protein
MEFRRYNLGIDERKAAAFRKELEGLEVSVRIVEQNSGFDIEKCLFFQNENLQFEDERGKDGHSRVTGKKHADNWANAVKIAMEMMDNIEVNSQIE